MLALGRRREEVGSSLALKKCVFEEENSFSKLADSKNRFDVANTLLAVTLHGRSENVSGNKNIIFS